MCPSSKLKTKQPNCALTCVRDCSGKPTATFCECGLETESPTYILNLIRDIGNAQKLILVTLLVLTHFVQIFFVNHVVVYVFVFPAVV